VALRLSKRADSIVQAEMIVSGDAYHF
jgi:hypothetical protein